MSYWQVLIRRVCPGLLILLIMGCAGQPGPGRTVSTSYDMKTGKQEDVRYSEYFEFDDRIIEGQVRMHLLITLGPERVPPNWWFPPSPFVNDGKLSKQSRADGAVEEVYEIYFTNLGDTPITFIPLDLEARPFGRVALTPSQMALGPKKFLKTEPIINIGSIYQPPEKGFTFRYSYKDNRSEIVGVARRLRLEELQRKK